MVWGFIRWHGKNAAVRCNRISEMVFNQGPLRLTGHARQDIRCARCSRPFASFSAGSSMPSCTARSRLGSAMMGYGQSANQVNIRYIVHRVENMECTFNTDFPLCMDSSNTQIDAYRHCSFGCSWYPRSSRCDCPHRCSSQRQAGDEFICQAMQTRFQLYNSGFPFISDFHSSVGFNSSTALKVPCLKTRHDTTQHNTQSFTSTTTVT